MQIESVIWVESRHAMNDRFVAYRDRYKTFNYETSRVEVERGALCVSFAFDIDEEICFRPTLEFPEPAGGWQIDPGSPLAAKMAFCIGMVEVASYWKTYCPARLHVRAGALCEEEVAWWKKLYFLGLGEFFHRNQIQTNRDDFMEIIVDDSGRTAPERITRTGKNLIPVGGGKDSIVSLEAMHPWQAESSVVLLNAPRAARRCAEAAGYTSESILEIRRTLDPRLLKLNARGALNGHTPFSALLAFSSFFAAALTGASRILLSNESSANEPTVPGSEVNHQYSKSFEFEEGFRRYTAGFLTPDIEYLSLLRPLNELQIASSMAKHPAYFREFRSCNVGSREDRWCGECPKCLFTYVMLQPFCPTTAMVKIFGSDLYDNPALEHTMEELLGCAETKPFECVGTVAEVRAAVSLAATNPKLEDKPRRLLEFVRSRHADVLVSREATSAALHEWNHQHNLPVHLEKRLRELLLSPS